MRSNNAGATIAVEYTIALPNMVPRSLHALVLMECHAQELLYVRDIVSQRKITPDTIQESVGCRETRVLYRIRGKIPVDNDSSTETAYASDRMGLVKKVRV